MNNKKSFKEPKLRFINKKEEFLENGYIDPQFIKYNDNSDENIVKIQNFDDLRRIKRLFDNLLEKNGYINAGLGNKCYLFEEEGIIKVKTTKNRIYFKYLNTKYGLIGCFNDGEFGGSISIISNENIYFSLDSGRYSFIDVFEYKNRVYAISSLSHLGISQCALHEIKKSKDNFELITIFETYDL